MPEIPRTKFISPWTVENIATELNGVKTARGSGTMTEMLATKQDLLVVGTNLDAIPTAESTNPVTSGGVQVPLAELIDNGAKNKFFKQPDRPDTASANGVTMTWNPDGTVSLTGTATAQTSFYLGINYDGSEFTTGDILSGVPSGSSGLTLCIQLSTSPYTKYANDTGSGASIPAVVVTGKTYRIVLVVASGTDSTGNVIKPMICTKAAWDVSHAYQPYRPSYQELYDMVLALQNGTRSLSMRSEPAAEPDEPDEPEESEER